MVRFKPTEEMENPFGQVQGGLLAGMLDNIIGPAVVSVAPERPTTTIQMNINYLRPAKPGDILIGTAKVVKHGRTQAYIEAELLREADNALLACATATNLFLDTEEKGRKPTG